MRINVDRHHLKTGEIYDVFSSGSGSLSGENSGNSPTVDHRDFVGIHESKNTPVSVKSVVFLALSLMSFFVLFSYIWARKHGDDRL